MRKPLIGILVILASMVLLFDRISPWVKTQDKNLLLLKDIRIEGYPRPLLAARKPHAAFYLDCRMKRIPEEIGGKEFIRWCKENDVEYVFLSILEANTRPLLIRTLDQWIQEVDILWQKEGWALIAKVK